MDLLCNAYSNSSDEEPEPKFKSDYKPVIPPPPKRFKPETPSQNLRTEAPVPGRYISKRERALSAQLSQVPNPAPTPNLNPNPTVVTSPVLGSISDSEIPPDVLSSLRQAKGRASLSQIPQRLAVNLRSHTKAVNALDWSPSHAHLLASAGMDQTVCVWNVWSRDQKIARLFKYHNAAVKDVKWSPHGLSVLSCGYDCSSRLIDVEKGVETQIFKEDQVVGAIKFCPDNSNIFLSGGSKGCLRLWDIRNGKVVHEYVRGLGPILDVEFTINGKQFISSSDVSGSNVSENSIIVWDISRQVPLSNQVYVEAYTCPSVRCHPFEPCFVAQSNANYIAIFSSSPPFRLDKYRRYESHGVSGFPIKCNFSLDGEKLVSGSSDGSIYIYNYRSSELVRKIKVCEQACIDVVYHPVLPNVIASCSWNGDVSIFE
ncbi:WD repeat-containing protein [Salix suchowensis]|nr:WD repeat-containing protein [Salix suchowensis]